MSRFKSRPVGEAVGRFACELRRLRTLRGMSQLGLSKAIQYSEAQVYRVEHADRWPTSEFAQRCDAALESAGALAQLWPEVEAARVATMTGLRVDVSRSTTVAVTDQALRGQLRVCSTSAGPCRESVEDVVGEIRLLVDEVLDDGAPETSRLERLESQAEEYARHALSVAPRDMLRRLGHSLVDAQHLCRTGGSGIDRARVRGVIARLAVLTADQFSVLGDVPNAYAWYGTAQAAAAASADGRLQADVCALAATVPLYYGQPTEAVRLARRSRRLAGDRDCLASVLAVVLEARAWALVGQTDRARHTLACARRRYDAVGGRLHGESFFGLSPRRWLFFEGRALTAVGDYPAAWHVHRQALGLYPAEVVGDPTLIHLDRAAGLIGTGHAADGAELLTATLVGVPPDHRGGLVLRTAEAVIDGVPAGAGHLPAVRVCRGVLADFGRAGPVELATQVNQVVGG